MNTHPRHAELDSYLNGDLSPKSRARIEEHIEECDRCQRLLDNQPPDFVPAKGAIEGDLTAGLKNRLKKIDPLAIPTQVETTPVDVPEQVGAYRIEGPIECGGMGQVLRARDEKFDRALAVKLLLPKFRGISEAEELFLQEARLTGSLQHPGIPPVHDVGRADDGRPFFAMKLIEGQTLTDLLQARPTPHSEWPRFLANFEQLAQTLAFAHQQGVIHRDLKPHNVMVGAFGEVHVMDWGLAKELRDQSRDEGTGPENDGGSAGAANAPCTDETVDWPHATPGARSDAGQVMGTFPYMPPEQARGHVRRLDERSDVFALGAILCQILTGAPVYRGKTHEQVYRKARDAELSDAFARLANSGADAELVDLACKCLAENKEDRPRDGAAVADSVSKYLSAVQERLQQERERRAAEKVEAQEQQKRWRLAFSLSATLIFVLLAGIGGVAWFWRSSVGHAAHAEDQRQKAVQARHATRKALDQLTSSAIADLFSKQTRITKNQKAYLEKVLKQYEEFCKSAGNSVQDRIALAEAYFWVARLRERLGLQHEALPAMEKTLTIRKELAARFPRSPEHQDELAAMHNDLSILLSRLGRRIGKNSQEEHLKCAIQIREELLNEHPGNANYIASFAASLSEMGILSKDLGRYTGKDSAEEYYRKAIRLQQSIVQKFPASEKQRRQLSAFHSNLAILLRKLGKNTGRDSAESHYRKALRHLTVLNTKPEDDAEFAQLLARTHNNFAVLLENLGRQTGEDSAEEHYKKAIALSSSLAIVFPAEPEYLMELAGRHNNYGDLLWALGRNADAARQLREGLKIRKQLLAAFPSDPGYREDLASSHNNFGVFLNDLGRRHGPDSALVHHKQALKLRRKLANDFPKIPEYRQDVAESLVNIGVVYVRLHKRLSPDSAESHYMEAMGILQDLVAKYPKVTRHKEMLALVNLNVGGMYLDEQQFARSKKFSDEAINSLVSLRRKHPELVKLKRWLRSCYKHRARALEKLGEHKLALKDRNQLLELEPQQKPTTRLERALCLARVGEIDDAMQEVQSLSQLKARGHTILIMAQTAAVCAAKGNPDQQNKYAAIALKLLRRANALAWFDNPGRCERMLSIKDFDILKGRPDFAEFQKGLGKAPTTTVASFEDRLKPSDPKDTALQDLVLDGTPYKVHKVKLRAGKLYEIEMVHVDEFDPYLRLEDEKRKELTRDDDGGGGRDARIVFTPKQDSTYRIIATTLFRTGRYHVQVRDGGRVHVVAGDGLDLKGRLTKSDPLDQYLRKQKTHHKVHLVRLEAGKAYQLDLNGNFDTFLRIEDAKKNPLLDNDDVCNPTNLNSRLIFAPAASGVYRLIATSYLNGKTGDYILKVRRVKELGKPSVYSGELTKMNEKTNRKYYYKDYKIPLRKGIPCTIELMSKAFDTYLFVLDPSGRKVVAKNDDVAPDRRDLSRIDLTPSENATFHIRVTSFGPGETGRYALRIQQYEPLSKKGHEK